MKNLPVAIVTGASRGIGRTVVIGLAKLGFRIAMVSRTISDLQRVSEEVCGLEEFDLDSHPLIFPIDISSDKLVHSAVSEISRVWGRIDLVFNGAGVFHHGTLDIENDKLEQLLAVNLKGAIYFMQHAIPIMKNNGGGHIINVSSISGKFGYAGFGAYAASKFALVGIGQSCFKELAEYGIKVTTICPGWVNTDMAIVAGSRLPPNQMIQPSDIMKTVEWLLSLSPSTYINEIIMDCRMDLD